MRVTQQVDDLRLEGKPIVLAAGSFDGMHKGHQVVITEAVTKAEALGGEAWALTLDPHPLKVLKPAAAPPLITSTPHKLRLMENLGVSGCVVLPFTKDVANEPAEEFIARLKKSAPTLTEIVAGDNWTFGRKAEGNVKLLRKLASVHGFSVTVMDPLLWEGSPISSTRVREAVARGDLDDAAEMLGRPFSIFGTVIRGRQIGTQLGFPTANLDPHNEVRPPNGVYAVRVVVGSREFSGAAFLAGPSFAQASPSGFVVEVHLLDFDMDIYHREIEVFFLRWIRAPQRFDSRHKLKAQIAADVAQIRQIVSNIPNIT